jgi:hypothetical protein
MPPKNPVRAARQASRQAVRSARITNRQDARTIRTAAKVDKIVKRTATKVNKINDKVVTRANKEPMTKMEPKGMTKIEPKGGSTGLVPAPQLTGPKPSTPRSVTPAAPVKKTAPVKKSTPKSTPKAKTPAPAPAKKYSPAVELAIAKKNYEEYRKKQQQGTYITKPESRNMEQKSKVKVDNVKKIVEDLKAIQDKYKKPAPPKKKETPRMRVPGMTDWNNTVDKYSKKRLGGAMKSKKC